MMLHCKGGFRKLRPFALIEFVKEIFMWFEYLRCSLHVCSMISDDAVGVKSGVNILELPSGGLMLVLIPGGN